jgi:hypothetical protein
MRGEQGEREKKGKRTERSRHDVGTQRKRWGYGLFNAAWGDDGTPGGEESGQRGSNPHGQLGRLELYH